MTEILFEVALNLVHSLSTPNIRFHSLTLGYRNLPSKNPEEAEKHRQEYEAMVEAARRKGSQDLHCY